MKRIRFHLILFLNILFVPYIVSRKRGFNTISTFAPMNTQYVPQVISKTCLLKPQSGPCRASIKMYYYEPEKTNCSTFFWGGCQGNGNRFDTLSQCLGTCLTQPHETKPRPKFCNLSFDYGYCFGAVPRYFYDKLWQVCRETIYSGCGGNDNNFYAKEQCDSICRFGTGVDKKRDGKGKNLYKYIIENPPQATTKKGKKL